MSDKESDDRTGDGSGGILESIMDGFRLITPGFLRRSFALKFGLVLLVLGLSVGAVGWFGSQTLEQEFQEEVNGKFASLAKQQASALADWNSNNQQVATSFSQRPVIRSANASEINNHLLQQRRFRNDWGGQTTPIMNYVDTNTGKILASTNFQYRDDFVQNISADAQRTVLQVSEQESVRTRPINGTDVGQGDSTVYIGYATGIRNKSDRALLYMVPVKTYTGSLSGGGVFSAKNAQGVALVVDGKNRILFEQYGTESQLMRPYGENNGMAKLARTQGPSVANASVEGPATGALADVEVYGLSNKEYVVGSANVQDTQWAVLIHTPKKQAYGEVTTVANQALYATGFGVLLIIVFGAVLGRNTATAIDRLTGKAEEMEEGNLEVDLSSKRVDNVGRLYDGFANMRDALNQQIQEAEQARKEAEVSRAEAMEMSSYLQETADEYAQIMQQCGAGDLTQRMDADGENEAMDRIAAEFNDMIDELEKTTGQLKSFADEVETAGEVVQTSSESVRDASEQVADSVQKISDDAYEQKEQLQEISETMDEIAGNLDTFAGEHPEIEFGDSLDRIEEIAGMISEVVDLSEETMAESENVAGAAEEQAAELNEVTQRAEDLSRYARPLREVLDRFETESEHEFYFPTGPGSGEGTVPEED